MSEENEWFSGRSVDEPVVSWLDVVIEIFCMACLGVLIAVALPGCATTEEVVAKVCYVKVMGQTEDGGLLEFHHCMAPEVFAEKQK